MHLVPRINAPLWRALSWSGGANAALSLSTQFPPVRKAAGSHLRKVARLALEAVLKNGSTLEIAHQQFDYGPLQFALSSRIGGRGQLILEVDIGIPVLADRIILEEDLRQAERARGVIQRSRKQRYDRR